MSGSRCPRRQDAAAGRSGVSCVRDRIARPSEPVWIDWIATARAKTTTNREKMREIRDQRMVWRDIGTR